MIPAATNKSAQARGISNHQGEIRNVARDHCTGGYERVNADFETTQNRGICADAGPLSHQCGRTRLKELAAGNQVVSKNATWSEKNAILDPDPFPQRHSVLDYDIITDDDVRFDIALLADIAIFAQACTFQHVSEGPYTGALADQRGFYNGLGMDENLAVIHLATSTGVASDCAPV